MLVVHNHTRGQPLVSRAELADTFWGRLRGLMGRPSLAPGEGLILKGEKNIHTFFMRFPIDVLYVDTAWRVVRLDKAMPPNRIGPFVPRSFYVVELPEGVIEKTGSNVGDQLALQT
jgi:uncharacterized membrane protein (UPF0127 family)